VSKHTIDRRTFFALTAQATKFEYTPREIVPQAGESVVLELEILDFVHGFSVPDLKLRADLAPGQVVCLSFTPTARRTIDFLCDNFCGYGHEEMNGKFIVKAWTEAPCVC
jgi:cytochrome c oxidase subunit 2